MLELLVGKALLLHKARKIIWPPAFGNTFIQGIKGKLRIAVYVLVHTSPKVDSVVLLLQ